MRCERLAGASFGARVEVDLHAVDGRALRQLLAAHHLLVLSGDFTDEEHVALVANFGRVLPQGPRVIVNERPLGDQPIVTLVTNQVPGEGLGAFELLFHHDLAHVATPLAGLSLYALDVAPGQTPTRFADGALAYCRLSGAMQQRLDRLQGLFIGNYTTISEHAVTARLARDRVDPTWPHAVHPIVVPHPVTRDPCVFVNEMQTTAILGLPTAESDELLDALFALLYDPAHVYEHQWRPGDLVVWDNLAVQHARAGIDTASPRVLRRVVFGEKAPWEEWPHQARC
jgi:taurine dioxygenase